MGAGIGGLAGGVGELVAGSLVKDVTYTTVADLMISERSVSIVSPEFLMLFINSFSPLCPILLGFGVLPAKHYLML